MASEREDDSRPGRVLTRSARVYLGLGGLLVAVRLLFVLVPPSVPVASQAALLSWPAVVGLGIVGAVGLAALHQTSLGSRQPAPTVARPVGRRLVLPPRPYLDAAVVGVGLAGAFVALDRLAPLGVPHVDGPLSVPFYLYGAVASELLFRLVPLAVVVWVATRLGAGPRWQAGAFAAGAAVVALVEPLGLLGTLAPASGLVLTVALGLTYLLNLAAAYLFWQHGFLTAVVERAAFYLVWHVVYGGLA